jgi:hypothetical protein
MNTASRHDIASIFGDLDELVVAKVEALAATPAELRKAREWIFSDSVEFREGSPSPKVGKLAMLLREELAPESEDHE